LAEHADLLESISGLREELVRQTSGIKTELGVLAANTAGFQQTMAKQVSDMDRRMGSIEASVQAAMTHSQRVGERSQQAEADLRAETAELKQWLRAEMSKITNELAKREGAKEGAQELRAILQWGVAIIGGFLAIIAAIIAFS
jgi:chromosome segregation ATPase